MTESMDYSGQSRCSHWTCEAAISETEAWLRPRSHFSSHGTTREGAAFVEAGGARLGGTITPHHLSYNRNALFKGGIRPHLYCLPIAKAEEHRQALRRAATAPGQTQFFLGTDTAPHTADTKECACGCAGVFNAAHALESYAKVFDEEGALDRLQGFASEFGPRFYGLPLNPGQVRLQREPQTVPQRLAAGAQWLVPFHAGATLAWRFTGALP